MPLLPNGSLVNLPRSADRRYGLLDVFSPQSPGDNHWVIGGVNFEDDLCGASLEAFLDNCPPVTGFTKTNERGGIDSCASDPFQVKAGVLCSTGGRAPGEWFEIARQRLLQWEGKKVEEVFWTGVTANGNISPSLATGNDDCDLDVTDLTGGGGAVNPVDGISLLEDAIADTFPGEGYIHVPTRLPAYLKTLDQMDLDNGVLYSPSGNRYVVGTGYPGSGPANVAAGAGTTWIFATGPIGIWRSNMYMTPEEIGQAVNRSINDVEVMAERYYVLGFSCAVFAVNVDLTCACA